MVLTSLMIFLNFFSQYDNMYLGKKVLKMWKWGFGCAQEPWTDQLGTQVPLDKSIYNQHFIS